MGGAIDIFYVEIIQDSQHENKVRGRGKAGPSASQEARGCRMTKPSLSDGVDGQS